jgi:hypothetical protein
VVAPVVIAGGTAVTSITAFLKAKMRTDSNYCTALLANGDLIVSKVKRRHRRDRRHDRGTDAHHREWFPHRAAVYLAG